MKLVWIILAVPFILFDRFNEGIRAGKDWWKWRQAARK